MTITTNIDMVNDTTWDTGRHPDINIITINITELLLSPVDMLVKEGVFPSRSHFFRIASIHFMRLLGHDTNGLDDGIMNVGRLYNNAEKRVMKNDGESPFEGDVVEYYINRSATTVPAGSFARSGSRIITVNMTMQMVKALEKVTGKKNGFFSRSEFVRMAAVMFLNSIGWLKHFSGARGTVKRDVATQTSKGDIDMRRCQSDDVTRNLVLSYLRGRKEK